MSKDSPTFKRAEQILEGLKKNFTALEEFASNDTPKRTQKDDDLRSVNPKNYRDEAETLSKFHETRINTFRNNALKALKAEIEPVNPQLFNDTISKINSEADAALAKLAPKSQREQEVKDSPIAAALKEKLFQNNNPLDAPIARTGIANRSLEIGPMSPSASKKFTDQLIPYVDFSGINKNALANNEKALEQGIGPIIQKAIIRDFGKPIVNSGTTLIGDIIGHTLNEASLTPERIKAFGHDVSQEVANYSQQMELAERTFKRCEDNGMKFSPEQKEKIMKQLAPTLNSLGSDHLEKNMDDIAINLSNKLKGNRSIISRITGRESVSSATLDKITVQFANEETPKSINASLQALQNMKQEHSIQALPSDAGQKQFSQYEASFNSKVQIFAMNNGIMNTSSKTTPQEIAKIRLMNPKAFDEAVFSQKTQNRSAEEVMHTAKGAQAIDEITHSGGTPTPKRPPPPPLAQPRADPAISELKDLEVKPEAKTKEYQNMHATAAQEAHAAAAPKKPIPLIYTGVKDHQAQKGIRDLDKQLKAKTKEYQNMYLPVNKANPNPDDNHVHHPNTTPKVNKPVTIGRHRDKER